MTPTKYYGQAANMIVREIQVEQASYNDLDAGATLSQYNLVCIDGAYVLLSDAGNRNRMPAVGMASEAATSGGKVDVFFKGIINNPSWSWTSGSPLYASSNGAMTHTAPSLSGDVAQRVARALTATKIEFDPSETIVRIDA